MDPFFITSDYTMQLSFMAGKQHCTCEKSALNVSRLHMEPNSLAFESFPMISNDIKLFVESLLMQVQILFAFGTNLHPIMFPIPRLRPSATFFVFDVKFTVLKFLKPHDNFSHLRQHHHMLLQAIYEPQLQISSN